MNERKSKGAKGAPARKKTENKNPAHKTKVIGHTAEGVLHATARGYAFITPDGGGKDFFVPKKAVNGAFDGDRVLFAHVRGTDDEAEVLKITGRNPSPVVGTFVRDRRQARAYPDDVRRPLLIIPRGFENGAASGQKVVCVITKYQNGLPPFGKVTEILGDEGELFAEELSIIRAHGLREEFPEEAAQAAREAAKDVPMPGNERDLRDKIIFTIDGEDTRDIDDAVSLEIKDGNYVLGVHIADVSRYVKYGSALDREAYLRGTSVYFPDRVLPMLPKELSNGICSINEGEDRYALTCEMIFSKEGERLGYEIYESVIRSRHKTSYPEITAICEGASDKYPDIAEQVKLMKELCLILEKRRDEAGGVNLDVKEAHIYLDEKGKICIPKAERTISERIIEQFMIAANEAVADFTAKRNIPCLYRIHERPSPEKASEFFTFLKYLGVNATGNTEEIKPQDYKKILAESADKPFFSVINKVMLRSMQKARYCGENKGHFGLASECYCHFTSPIRRYPDLFVHRSLKEFLHGGYGSAKAFFPLLEAAGSDTSEKERTADDAERDVDDLYKLAFMTEHVGEEYEGIISGVTPDAVYCKLENTVEGIIPLEDLPADDYEFIGEKLLLKGKKHKFRIGGKLKVLIAACDLGRMKVIMRVLL